MAYKLNFHQSIAPETEALAQILRVASESHGYLSKEEISEITMIPTGKKSGKVVPHIYYATAMGLINFERFEDKYLLSLSNLGEIIFKEDPYLIEDITKILCHYEIAHKSSPAALWVFVFNFLIPKTGYHFTHTTLESAALKMFQVKNINFSPFRSCLTAERSLNVGIMDIEGNQYHLTPHSINFNYLHLYSYLLLKKWEDKFKNQTEITINHLTEDLGYGNPFLWDETTVMNVLEVLEEEGVIVLNRQLSPTTLIKQVSAEYSLNKIFNYII